MIEEVAPGLRRWTAFHDHWESRSPRSPSKLDAFQTARVNEVVFFLA